MIRYSRVLVCLPPLDNVVEEVREYLEERLDIMPEFIDTPGLLGFAIAWSTWSFTSGVSEWMLEVQEKYMCPVIEYTDEDHFEYLELGPELREGKYCGRCVVTIFPDYFQIDEKEKIKWSGLQVRHMDLINSLDLLRTMKILYKRGYFNRDDVNFELKEWFRLQILNNE